jgi:hypothetical protein
MTAATVSAAMAATVSAATAAAMAASVLSECERRECRHSQYYDC